MGGIGNVLFQGFFGFITSNKGYQVSYNGFLTKNNLITKLLGWTIHENNMHKTFFNKVSYDFNIEFFNIIKLLISKAFKFKFQSIFIFENESIVRYDGTHYFGYFQSMNLIKDNIVLFNSYCLDLRKALDIKLSVKPQIVVHFRWGDSEWAKKNITYYEKVLEILISDYDSHKIYIVTDDKTKALSFFSVLKNKEVFKRSTFEDFKTLCNASVIFVSPSTFSWWASQVGDFDLIYFPSNFKEYRFINNSSIICIE